MDLVGVRVSHNHIPTSVCGLKLLVYDALRVSYNHIPHINKRAATVQEKTSLLILSLGGLSRLF